MGIVSVSTFCVRRSDTCPKDGNDTGNLRPVSTTKITDSESNLIIKIPTAGDEKDRSFFTVSKCQDAICL